MRSIKSPRVRFPSSTLTRPVAVGGTLRAHAMCLPLQVPLAVHCSWPDRSQRPRVVNGQFCALCCLGWHLPLPVQSRALFNVSSRRSASIVLHTTRTSLRRNHRAPRTPSRSSWRLMISSNEDSVEPSPPQGHILAYYLHQRAAIVENSDWGFPRE